MSASADLKPVIRVHGELGGEFVTIYDDEICLYSPKTTGVVTFCNSFGAEGEGYYWKTLSHISFCESIVRVY